MTYLLYAMAYLWVFYGMYSLVMGFYRAYLSGKMPTAAKILALPYLLIGGVMDVLANMTLATIILAEWPHEWLVTTRLSRLENDTAWRGDVARWVCENLLDPLDPTGEHCKVK
jgi:hypothetical protein